MSEIVELAGTIANAGWIYLCVLFVVALGLFVLDGRWKAPVAESTAASREQKAA